MKTLIRGTGSYAPERVVTNRDLEKLVDTDDRWIVERTGIRERRIIGDHQATSDMAYEASVRALEMARLDPRELELIVVGTITPDMPWPAAAVLLQERLGNKKASGQVRHALVVGAETLTRITDWSDRNTCILFGDAAGALVLGPTEERGRGIQSLHLHTDGAYAHILNQPGGGSRMPISQRVIDERAHYVKMNGREVYRLAIRALEEGCREALAANQMAPGDVDFVIAHQANKRILDAVLERLAIPAERCWMNLEKYGNTSSASLPMTLDEAHRAGWFRPGSSILAMAIGGGLAWGTGIIRW
jgi:3-oxoacyl-[acyl-carrier-protein] synthase-3